MKIAEEGKDYPLQYSGLENSMDDAVHGPKESDTNEQLSLTCVNYIYFLIKLAQSYLPPVLKHISLSLFEHEMRLLA